MQPVFLVIDDVEQNRRGMQRLLENYYSGCRVLLANDGRVGYELAVQHQPDLILLDAQMPEQDGFSTCSMLKSHPRTQSILVLMISAVFTNRDDRIQGLECGADSYLCKPFENMELRAQIAALLRIRNTERELREAKVRAEQASVAKSWFLAQMSHELRTPMNAVIGLTDILLGTDLNDDQQQLAETIRSSGETQLSIINDILDFSKMESGKMQLRLGPASLEDLIKRVMQQVRPSAEAKGLELRTILSTPLPPSLRLDGVRVAQILLNLVGNAIKFTHQGHVTVRASCTQDPARKRTECITLEVEDTGIGIPADRMDKLFEAFEQMESTDARRYEGTGLGLTICKRLVALMKGELSATSEVAKGTIFRVTFRAEHGADDADAPATPEVKKSTGTLAQDFPLRILLAEDNPVNQMVASRMLLVLGYACDVAHDGGQALEKMKENDYDVLLLDLQMPVLDGIEVARRIASDWPPERRPQIVAVTASAMEEDRQRCEDCGMCDFLPKPMREADLRALLQRCIKRAASAQP